ncbi:pilus assembly protein TadG-related protein [Bradyrhizobium sp. USDA 3315]
MRKLLRCRRGSVAFATVTALVPLIGAIALGAEAGSWYVTKQSAQNAADAGAYSGALTLACSLSSATANCDTAQTYDYRGRQFVARNGFCNSGDSFTGVTCPTGLTQTVSVERGTYASGTFTSSGSGRFVRATVTQTQPAFLASVLGFSSVTIGGLAIAEVQNPKELCALGLSSTGIALTLGGGGTLTGDGCALMSNNTVKYASTPTFSGPGWAVDAVNGCTNSGNCDPGVPYNYSMLPATNPFNTLDSASFNTMPNISGNNPIPTPNCSTLSPAPPAGTTQCYLVNPNSAGAGYGSLNLSNANYAAFVQGAPGTYFFNKNISVSSGATIKFASGTYYFNGNFNGNGTVDFAPGTYFFNNSAVTFGGAITCSTCTGAGTSGVTFVLLGNSTLSISSSAHVNLTAPATNSYSSLLNGVLIDDQAPNRSSNNVTINGSSTVSLFGAMYFPNVDVTWNGSSANVNTGCTQVVANTLTIGGTANFSTGSCPSGTVGKTQVVALVR